MAYRRRLRPASGHALILAAAVLLLGPPVSAAQTPRVFVSRANAPALQCPSPDAAPARPPLTSNDRIPDGADLQEGEIELPPPSARRVPQLPPDLVRGFAWPSEGSAPLRVAVWGDSHVAAGFITDEFGRLIEAAGLKADTSVIPASVGRPGVRVPVRKVCKGGGWQFQAGFSAAETIRVGPSLANLRSSRAGDYLWLDLRHRNDRQVRGVQLQYLPSRGRARIGIRVDDGAEVAFDLVQSRDSIPHAPGVLDLRADGAISTIKLRVIQGEVILHGFMLDHAHPPPITIDVFGLPSATAKGWANADVAYLKQAMPATPYDAIVLEYGTNEGAVAQFDPAKYAAVLAASLRNVRAVFPDAACLLIGPTDRGVRVATGRPRGSVDLLRYSRIHQQITRMQAQAGAKAGCAVWDWQGYMGGAGSMYAWAREAPPAAAADLIHLTPPGYRRTAAALARSLGWVTP